MCGILLKLILSRHTDVSCQSGLTLWNQFITLNALTHAFRSLNWDLWISRGPLESSRSPSQIFILNKEPKFEYFESIHQYKMKSWLGSLGHTLAPSLESAVSGMKPLTEATYRETVLLGRKLGCRVSIKSTSSHTTLTRTCCLLSSLDLSAEQWQLSTIRSGQFLLHRLDCHSPTITHSKLSALMVDSDFETHAPFKLCPPSLCDKSGPFHIAFSRIKVQPVIELQPRSHAALITCCVSTSCKLSALLLLLINAGEKWNVSRVKHVIFAILCDYESFKLSPRLLHA